MFSLMTIPLGERRRRRNAPQALCNNTRCKFLPLTSARAQVFSISKFKGFCSLNPWSHKPSSSQKHLTYPADILLGKNFKIRHKYRWLMKCRTPWNTFKTPMHSWNCLTENKYIYPSSLEWPRFCYNTRMQVYAPAINDAYKCYDITLCRD